MNHYSLCEANVIRHAKSLRSSGLTWNQSEPILMSYIDQPAYYVEWHDKLMVAAKEVFEKV